MGGELPLDDNFLLPLNGGEFSGIGISQWLLVWMIFIIISMAELQHATICVVVYPLSNFKVEVHLIDQQ